MIYLLYVYFFIKLDIFISTMKKNYLQEIIFWNFSLFIFLQF